MLTGSKILLRVPGLSDVDFMLSIENDKRYWHLSGNTSPYSIADMETFVKESTSNLESDKQLRLVIFEIASKTKIGLIDIFEYEALHRRAGIGVFICDEFRGKGLAADALRVLVHYLFEIIQLHQVWCNVLSDNEASLKMFTAAGFKQTGLKKEWLFFDDSFHDEALLQLINPKHST